MKQISPIFFSGSWKWVDCWLQCSSLKLHEKGDQKANGKCPDAGSSLMNSAGWRRQHLPIANYGRVNDCFRSANRSPPLPRPSFPILHKERVLSEGKWGLCFRVCGHKYSFELCVKWQKKSLQMKGTLKRRRKY